ncbi:MAG: Asp-tRNA(Asn)/Glu-tRNA(Gln) amidotransferase GatCAB subunit A [Candidatus Levybacteria bacterium CG10_big_fil_rev_8_21_14_0_10_35_13]|nr:MAG: Asp-tRNA(Asn)/Glu-tRNA(Gln) amidotransferase GatCAB subunit A [Candidatus Levybacteria bacterium CG10_big_fil_rev_8_21_14_0_10_35_13]
MKPNNLTIKKAKEGLRKKEFSAVELLDACLERIEKKNSELNAFLNVCKSEALEQAKHADKLISEGQTLPLLGIPVALKDLFSTKGIKTTAGSKVLENYIPPYDATVVKKLKDAGAVVIGKTNLDAWAHGSSGENSDFEPAKNPWNTKYVPGGSSSGSAIAVSANMCIASTGTDTGGSVRLPASFTNTVGLKPTYGRVSRYGIIAMASSLDSIGHFTKTVEDNALFLNVTAGHDEHDATTPPEKVDDYVKDLNKDIKGLKIGVPKEYFAKGLELKIKENIENALKFYEENGAEIVNISLPHTNYAIATYYIIQPAEVSSNLARYDGIRFGSARQNFGAEAKRRIMLGTFTLSVGYYDAYYKKAMKIRTLIIKDFEDAFKKADVIITPVSPSMPWKFGEKTEDPLSMYLSDVYSAPTNLAGIPGLAVPTGFIDGLPVGMQILGPQFRENLLFNVGNIYEIAHKWYERSPDEK